ncbi:hypothetical protein JR316_0001679 [Psilocybe cubensis]|uniref:Uncharacterized protein n=1 Tax=Psilocybe cubensis TaxID=181762 RepID=A0ACB8HAU7_PSICU|nr:hypothetical protein JR316_0001679 [Psilocybe cubensis]KAH9484777.1 hypothetical protein JR316_0001679 [Psilocybe cubensis]
MPHPGYFKGARLEFLKSQKAIYQTAREEGCLAEALADIQRRFFKRFPVTQSEEWEPTKEQLLAVNDEEPDPEMYEPDPDSELAVQLREKRKAAYKNQKDKIRRWFKYQYKKDHKINPTSSGSDTVNPYAQLLQQLLGKQSTRPRLKTPVNMWRKEKNNREAIEQELNSMVPPVETKHLAKTREEIARRLFKELSADEKRKWTVRASEEHKEAMEKYEADMAVDGISLSLEDRQRAIENLGSFIAPILEGICNITGWKVTFLAGGPEPANGGMLNTISVHCGVMAGESKMNFGKAERVRYKRIILPIFGDFLRKCYSKVDCQKCALPEEAGFISLSMLANFEDKESVQEIDTLYVAGEKNSMTDNPGNTADNHVNTTDNLAPQHTPLDSTHAPAPASPSQHTSDTDQSDTEKSNVNPFTHDWDENDMDIISQPPSTPPSPAPSTHNLPTPEPPSAPSAEPGTQESMAVEPDSTPATPSVPSATPETQEPLSSKAVILPPRSNHPNGSRKAISSVVESASSTSKSGAPKQKSNPNATGSVSAAPLSLNAKGPKRKGIPNAANAPSKKQKTASQPTSALPSQTSNEDSQRGQRLTRSRAPKLAVSTPTASVTLADPSTVILRSGKAAKPSRFWQYAEDKLTEG